MTVWEALHGDGVVVRCPSCEKDALLTEKDWQGTLSCTHCGRGRRVSLKKTFYAAGGNCAACHHRLYDSPPEGPKPPSVMEVRCARCGLTQPARVSECGYSRRDPLEGLVLYFRASYRGHPVWAFNRAHLDDLIAYTAAGERGPRHLLPPYLRLAKNRAGLLRLLKRMRAL